MEAAQSFVKKHASRRRKNLGDWSEEQGAAVKLPRFNGYNDAVFSELSPLPASSLQCVQHSTHHFTRLRYVSSRELRCQVAKRVELPNKGFLHLISSHLIFSWNAAITLETCLLEGAQRVLPWRAACVCSLLEGVVQEAELYLPFRCSAIFPSHAFSSRL